MRCSNKNIFVMRWAGSHELPAKEMQKPSGEAFLHALDLPGKWADVTVALGEWSVASEQLRTSDAKYRAIA